MGLVSDEIVLHAAGRCTDGFGGWAVVLTYGSHQREISGSDIGATSSRMALRAVVEGLAALTRPARVRICVADETLHEHRARRRPPDEPDLWQRLRPLLARHHVAWDEASEWWDEVACDLAAELAHHQRRGAVVRAGAQGGAHDGEASLAVVLSRYLVERWDDMHAFEDADDVIGALRFSIGWYGDKQTTEMAPAEIVGELPDFFHSTLPHKRHASPHELRTAKTVVSELLDWLVTSGHLEAGPARHALDDIDLDVDERASVQAFVDAFDYDDLVPWPDSSLLEESIDSEYVRIEEVTGRSLTFKSSDDRVVGPIPLPPGIAAQARTGWRILLSAVKVRGRWGLVQVVSGDP